MTGYMGAARFGSYCWNRGFSGTFSRTTTLSPTDKTVSVTLSNGNLTATGNSPASPGGVRCTNGQPQAGKISFQVTQNTFQTATFLVIALPTWSMTANPGTDTSSIKIQPSNGNVLCNSVIIGTGAAFSTSGQVVDVALDLDNKLLWYRVNAGNWNNSATAHPDTGAGGFSYSALATGNVFAACYVQSGVVSAYTFNFEAATPVAGYLAWDA